MLTAHLDRVGGTESQCRLLASEARRRGLDVEIVTQRVAGPSADGGPVDVPVRRVWHPVHELGVRLRGGGRPAPRPMAAGSGSRPRSGLGALVRSVPRLLLERRLREVISAAAPRHTVLHLHGTFWHAMLREASRVARTVGRPFVVKVANEPERVLGALRSDPQALEALRGADAVIVVSADAERVLAAEPLRGRLVRIPNAVALPPRVRERSPRRHVLFVGTLKRQKGVDVLLRAWARTKPTERRLLIAGDGPERGGLAALAAELGVQDRVTFLGNREDVPALLDAAGLFVLPSRFEGMPNALLEAMSRAVPCVATQIGGVVDVVGDGGAVLVPPEDVDALAGAIEQLSTARAMAEELGWRGRLRVEEHFALPRVFDRVRALYDELCSRGALAGPARIG